MSSGSVELGEPRQVLERPLCFVSKVELKTVSAVILLDSATASALNPAQFKACLACCDSILPLEPFLHRSVEVIF